VPTPANDPLAYLFTGDRNWNDSYIVRILMNGLYYWQRQHGERLLVVEGEAPGLDIIARDAALSVGLNVRGFPAEWVEHGRKAGPIRNQQMLDENDVKAVFGFHDNLGESKGTLDMLLRARRAGLPTYQIRHF
jgi:hypothetical protein